MTRKIRQNRKLFITTGLVLLVSLVDLFSKSLVRRHLAVGEEIVLYQNHLDFVHVRNFGSAFGMFSQLPNGIRLLFFTVVFLIAVVILIKLIRETNLGNVPNLLAYTAILGGAFGNFANRVFNGHVTDFISFHWKSAYFFPAFNVADIAICTGVGLLIIRNVSSNEKVESKE
jgi:signal peptidase II